MSSEEKLITEFHGVKLNKQRGVLVLTSLRVAWAPGDITETFHANHLYEDIKGCLITILGSVVLVCDRTSTIVLIVCSSRLF